jgi:serine protease AprX
MPIKLNRVTLEDLIFGLAARRRFTQDSPILPDVWIAFGAAPDSAVPLLLTPHRDTSPVALHMLLRDRLAAWRKKHPAVTQPPAIASNASTVAATLTFEELVQVVLPLSGWWTTHVGEAAAKLGLKTLSTPKARQVLAARLADPDDGRVPDDLAWLARVVGGLEWARRQTNDAAPPPRPDELADHAADVLPAFGKPSDAKVWTVNRNRPAKAAVWRSGPAIKADAARRVFALSCEGLTWAVLDSGIDARHPAFRLDKKQSRVTATYDFTRIRGILDVDAPAPKGMKKDLVDDLRARLSRGRDVDFSVLEQLLAVPHDGKYAAPVHDHGTHVAGILGSGLADLPGICPDIRLIDLRVLDGDGNGDEFSIMAALQFVRWLNANKDRTVIHGVNMSLSIHHDVVNFACGRTPVCEEAERVVAAGIVVVAAAGNEGYVQYLTHRGDTEEFRPISITDPGNAESVITVGATHRYRPHTYGVSYFSSRGPTGDGRVKPDLVAPGEKIKAPVPGEGFLSKDGTSMAAPHVSGAAALLMARHPELIGSPAKVKQVLCSTATDLGRERYFQGAGMVDVLRALQAV